MNDLVKRLRKFVYGNYEMLNDVHESLFVAAAEIERLQKEVARLKEERRWLEADLDAYEKEQKLDD